MNEGPLSGIVVLEIGERCATGACGSLLAHLGAEVIFVDLPHAAPKHRKWTNRTAFAAGKHSIHVEPSRWDRSAVMAAGLAAAQLILTSSDADEIVLPDEALKDKLVCDITAFGPRSAPGSPFLSDMLLQALSGLADITGPADGPPVITTVPYLEFMAAIYAAAGVLAAVKVWTERGVHQRVEIAIFDCAFSMLTSFLPRYWIGEAPRRIGNHHSSMAPWNSYRAKDGWLLISSSSNSHWTSICSVLGRPELASDESYATPGKRVAANTILDELIGGWVAMRPVAECTQALTAAGISCGPVMSVQEALQEPNLRVRGLVHALQDPGTGAIVKLAGLPIAPQKSASLRIPAVGEDEQWVFGLSSRTARRPSAISEDRSPPLTGLRVVELGQFTTAPLACRQLGALGATVFKVEPPGGEGGRQLPPQLDGESLFFLISNSDKLFVELDLNTETARQDFAHLLSTSDSIVENLKTGALTRLGFGPDVLQRINPKLIHCGISGFGDSLYSGRPALDTTIQGVAGLMDVTRGNDIPYKTGISTADVIGGQMALLAVLAAILERGEGGATRRIDISMQDATAWLTQLAWNGPVTDDFPWCLLPCCDGWVITQVSRKELEGLLNTDVTRLAAGKARAQLIELLASSGIVAAPVQSITEVSTSDYVRNCGLVRRVSAGNSEWNLLACPIRLSATPARVSRVPGRVGSDQSAAVATAAANNHAHQEITP
jgi:crotonobetainyl-CoA:carnitine CoA-transferase CaiB-like acyl-CoA transferase